MDDIRSREVALIAKPNNTPRIPLVADVVRYIASLIAVWGEPDTRIVSRKVTVAIIKIAI
ncbi:hypothetical protein D9M70_554510 [compost metagenome]